MELKEAKKAIASNLKRARKACGYEVSDVVKMLNNQFGVEVAEKTCYGWESAAASPTSTVLCCLCKIYHITSTAELFNGAFAETKNITNKERESAKERNDLYKAYIANPDLQKAVKKLLDL